MFNSMFKQTLYTKRWMTISWSAGIAFMTGFTMVFFPTFKKVGQSFQDVPDSLKSFLGDASAYSSIEGYTDLQIFSQLPFMLIIMAIVMFTGLIAGDESSGVLQSLLAQPVKRSKVFFEKLFAGITIMGVACFSMLVGVIIGMLIVGEQMSVDRMLLATLASLLISLVFGVMGFALGAISGKRGFAGGVAGVLAFASMLISSLAEGVKSLRFADKFSPFHYFNKPGIMQNGINWSHVAILTMIIIVLVVVSWFRFIKRDVYQQ